MGLLGSIIVSLFFCQVIGAPLSEEVTRVPNELQCLNATCQCSNVTNQIYDFNLQKCVYIVGSTCNISVIGSEIIFADIQSLLSANCTSNSECNGESLTCQCKEGFQKTDKLTCENAEVTTNNYIPDYEEEDIVTISFAKFCDNATTCDSTEDLVCTNISDNSTTSMCLCRDSTYIYQAGPGCIAPYGIKLSDLLIIKETMRRYRRQRELILLANGTSPEDLADRQGMLDASTSKLEDGAPAKYQILDRNEYQPQNLFGQMQQNFPNNNGFPNFGNPSSQEITNGNNFQNPNPINFPNQNLNVNTRPNPIANNFPNQNPVVNNNVQNTPAPANQVQFIPQNNQNPNNVNPPQFQSNQNSNGMPQQFPNPPSAQIPQQFPNPSSGQFQQPFQPVVQYQQPPASLLSLLFSPIAQLLNPQQNNGNQNNRGILGFTLPFKREFRAIIAFFARVINTFLPVLRTLDYQLSPILTNLGNFRYNDNTNSNYGQNNQNYQQNFQQNTQGYVNPQSNGYYPGNSLQPAG